MQTISGRKALATRRANPARNWNSSASSNEPSQDPDDAMGRIYDGFARIRPDYSGPRIELADPVFTMGSCFAREVETALAGWGGNVVSLGPELSEPVFRDAQGRPRTGFFHRFTPHAMLQELRRAFDELPAWSDDALLLRRHHRTGRFELVVTVSPVPMSSTFTGQGVVVANARSKAVLRAAAAEFTDRHEQAHYFPSYEMVTCSAPSEAWKADRLHVNGRITRGIVKSFVTHYYRRESLMAARIDAAT